MANGDPALEAPFSDPMNCPFPKTLLNELRRHLRVEFTKGIAGHTDLLSSDLSGHTSLIFAPPAHLCDILRRYHQAKVKDGLRTSAVIVAPSAQASAPWVGYLRNMLLIKEYRAGALDLGTCTLPWPVQVWYDPPLPPPPPRPPTPDLRCVLAAAAQGSGPSMVFPVRISGSDGVALIDSGASAIFASEEFCRAHGIQVWPCQGQVTLAGNQIAGIVGRCKASLRMGKHVSHAFEAYVMPELVHGVSLILGDTWMRRHKVVLDYERMQCSLVTSRCGRVCMPAGVPGAEGPAAQEPHAHAAGAHPDEHDRDPDGQACNPGAAVPPPLSAKQARRALKRGAKHFLCSLRQVDAPSAPCVSSAGADAHAWDRNPSLAAAEAHVPREDQEEEDADAKVERAIDAAIHPQTPDPTLMCPQRLRKLLQRFKHLFPDKLPAFAAQDHGISHTIDLIPGAKIPYKKPYRMSPKELEEAKRQVKEFLDKGIVVPSQSPFGANMFFVSKPDGSLRAVVDFRHMCEAALPYEQRAGPD